MKVLLFGNNFQEQSLVGIKTLIGRIAQRGIDCAVEAEFYNYLIQQLGEELPATPFGCDRAIEADLAISLGGDGTFLTTVMWVAEQHIPILGVNTGHLGYLTTCNVEGADQMLECFINGEYKIDQRTMLCVSCDQVEIKHPFALNDIAILRCDTSSMIEMETTLRDLPLTTYKGDGLVVSTPTGSTAYNMSAGGPIIEPTASCLVLTPVSPHSLTMRPLVVADDATVSVVTYSRAGHYLVSLDGECFTCPSGSTITINKSPIKVLVVQPLHHNFATTLRHKLSWGI